MADTYPAEKFPGTPPIAIWVIRKGIRRAGVVRDKWEIPLQAIARYESDLDPYIQSVVCADCRGMMQLSRGMYDSALTHGLIKKVDFNDPVQAVELAIRYIKGEIPGYGGYGGIGTLYGKTGLLPRTDRGPGEALRKWVANPDWGFEKLRPYYHGY